MGITIDLPPEIVRHVRAGGSRVAVKLREAVLVELYREGALSEAELRRALGVDRFEIDRVLSAHGVWLETTADEVLADAARSSAARTASDARG